MKMWKVMWRYRGRKSSCSFVEELAARTFAKRLKAPGVSVLCFSY
jgi:hypothetical protein